MTARALNVGDTLMQLPVFQGSTSNRNQTINNTQSARTGLNLRNLGSNRTLVLFDGRRLPASNTENVANVGLIPDTLIKRVDVVTGGASAVYGSDAVSGVVSYILDTDFTGLNLAVQGGISSAGDGESTKASLTAAPLFSMIACICFSRDLGRTSRRSREETAPGTPPARVPYRIRPTRVAAPYPQFLDRPCCVATTYPAGGLILAGPLKGTVFGLGGTVGQYDYGYGLSTRRQQSLWRILGAVHDGRPPQDIMVADRAQHVFFRAGLDLTPDIELYAEYLGGWNHMRDSCCFAYYQTGIGTMYTSNPFIPASVLSQAQALNVTSFSLGSSLRYPAEQFGPGNIGPNNHHSSNVYVAGLNGGFTLGEAAWNWDVYGQWGVATSELNIDYNPIVANLANAIKAVRVGSFGAGYSAAPVHQPGAASRSERSPAHPTCSPLADPGATGDCVPYNIFGTGVASPAAIDYVNGMAELTQRNTLAVAGGSITGETVQDLGGPGLGGVECRVASGQGRWFERCDIRRHGLLLDELLSVPG